MPAHAYHFHFQLFRRRHFGTTKTANYQLAERLAAKHRGAVLEGRAGLRQPKPVLLSEHIKTYVAHTAKTNRSSNKDQRVLDSFAASVGDCHLADVSGFQVERWKRERADEVSRSSVNRELNIIRGCFSRAVEWGRLGVSPLRTVKPYRVDNVRLRVCSSEEIKSILEGGSRDLALLTRVTLESLLRLSEALRLRREDIGAATLTVVNQQERAGPPRAGYCGTANPLAHTMPRRRVRVWTGQGGAAADAGGHQRRVYASAARVGPVRDFASHVPAHGRDGDGRHGVSLRAVQTIGGWSTLRMVERYAHVDDAELARAVRLTHNHTDAAAQATTKTTTQAVSAGGNTDPKNEAK
jgi:integrase